jgi:hypothetical protein
MIKNIVSIGDSFLAGSELTYPLPDTQYTAPALLANKYGKKFINLAKPGIGLQLATYRLLENIENKNIDGNTLVIFCIPPVGRIDFVPTKSSNNFKSTLDYAFFSAIEEGKIDKTRLTDSFSDTAQMYSYLKDNIDIYKKGELHYLASISLLQNLMLIYDFKIITFFGFNANFICDQNHHVFDKIGFKQDVLSSKGFVHWANSNSYFIHENGHPGKEAHAALSEIIEKKVFEKYDKLF